MNAKERRKDTEASSASLRMIETTPRGVVRWSVSHPSLLSLGLMAGVTWHYALKFIITGLSPCTPYTRHSYHPPGDAAVGKSSLLVRLTDQRFMTNPDPTVRPPPYPPPPLLTPSQLGVEFGSKLVDIPEQAKIVKLQCQSRPITPSRSRSPPTGWDTAGTESFRSITRSYYRGAAGCVLVYDVTSRTSTSARTDLDSRRCGLTSPAGFINVHRWLADVRAHADPHLTCILVGNKVDLCEAPSAVKRQVTTEEGAAWAREHDLLFVEASAKSGHNVDRAFEDASRDILDKIQRGVFDDDRVRLGRPLFFFFPGCSSPYAVTWREAVQTCKRKRGARSRVYKGGVLLMMSGWFDGVIAEMEDVYHECMMIKWWHVH